MGARHAWPELDPSEQLENRPDKSGRQPAFMQPRPARHESDLGGVALKPQQLVAELIDAHGRGLGRWSDRVRLGETWPKELVKMQKWLQRDERGRLSAIG